LDDLTAIYFGGFIHRSFGGRNPDDVYRGWFYPAIIPISTKSWRESMVRCSYFIKKLTSQS